MNVQFSKYLPFINQPAEFMKYRIKSVKAAVYFSMLSFALLSVVLLSLSSSAFGKGSRETQDEYVCTPCGNDCDHAVYKEPGTCPHCGMPLVKKPALTPKVIQPDDVCKFVASHPSVVLLDVRSKAEYEGKADNLGTLQNAINIPINELTYRIHSIDSLKNREIIVYCSHSHRSSTGSYILLQNGFRNVWNMAGGMSAMKDNPCKIHAR
jgi:rhodanese-related sulfurtransferase